MKYKEYKKELRSESIDNCGNFDKNLQYFLDKHHGIKIIFIITHSAYHISIIYEELIEIKTYER